MRVLLVLLAMITGLSVPQVAVAFSRTEVAESGVSANQAPAADQRQRRCAQRDRDVPQMRHATARRKTVWLPAPALARVCGIELTDRARE